MKTDNKIRIAVLVSGGGTNLQALIDAQKSGKIKSGAIEIVISNNADAYALTRAELAGIPSAIVVKKEYGTQGAFEARILEILAENKIDLIVLAGFM
ncbi:MAG: phosphoribosylglycinamide formyltransferase, partial [Eubacteriales bacterium]